MAAVGGQIPLIFVILTLEKGGLCMTTGQRIAQKRKELGLSQEALGDRLGVTRQSDL